LKKWCGNKGVALPGWNTMIAVWRSKTGRGNSFLSQSAIANRKSAIYNE
jgi:hypothetical protein